MLARCLSASLQGLEARPVVVEVDLAPGLPGVQLVGLPDKAIQESRERVRSALRNSGSLVRSWIGSICKCDWNGAPPRRWQRC